MAPGPITIKLRCSSWKQLEAMYRRDLVRGALFLKSSSPPPIGTPVVVDLVLPTESHLDLSGTIARHIGPGELNGRGPGVDIKLDEIPESSMWMIESALMALQRHSSGPVAAPPGSADQALESHVPVADAEGQLVGALEQELASLRKLNPFQILGVGYEASDDAVRAAFGELTKSYHPDRFARYESQQARKIAAEIFILIRNAYQSLNTAEGRTKIASALSEKRTRKTTTPRMAVTPPPPIPRAATPPPIPRTAAPPPTPRTASGPHTPAPQPTPRTASGPHTPAPQPPPPKPEPAAEAPAADAPAAPAADAPAAETPAPPAPTGKHARALALLDAGRYDEAASLYSLATKRDGDDTAAKIGLELAEGFKALAERDRLEAAQRFEAVLELDPSNERAARVLAEMRRRATEERKGHLTRLLGKKG